MTFGMCAPLPVRTASYADIAGAVTAWRVAPSDDVNVLTAIVQRLDNSHARLIEEIRATHSQVARLGNRVRRLEEEAPPRG
jgi:ubiquinone biosynthesis protein UbiJ